MRNIITLILVVFWGFLFSQNQPDPRHIVNQMIDNCLSVKSLEFHYIMTERDAKGTLSNNENKVKVEVSPFKMYMKQIQPRAGMEILYKQGWNSNNALLNLNGFPWVNVSLDPMGSRMREGQHHTIMKMGIATLGEILKYTMDKNAHYTEGIKYIGIKTKNNKSCHHIEMEVPNFGFKKYIVKQGENLVDIAKKYYLSEYMIMTRNKGIDFYDDVSAGDEILIPTEYAKKIVLYVDEKTAYPVLMEIYDDKGLYERFNYISITPNVKFSETDFSDKNPNYGF